MKKLVLIITIFLLTVTSAFAGDNYLNTVILEGTDSGYNVILRSDNLASVKRVSEGENKLTLDIKGVTTASSLTTMYRNTSGADSVIVENSGNNSVKVYINAKNAANSNIIFDTPASSPVVVSDTISRNTLLWSILAFIVLSAIFFMSKNIKDDPHEEIVEAIQKNMRDREIEMYKHYRKELLTIPSIDYKVKNPRVKEAIRRADTIRHLQRVVNNRK